MTHSSLPSGVIAMRRGRLPTLTFLTTLALATSITCTMLATSEVTYSVLPSALTFTPSGSWPTLTLLSFLPLAASMKLTSAASSFET